MKNFNRDLARYKENLKFVLHEPSIVIVFVYRLRTELFPNLPFGLGKFLRVLTAPVSHFLTLLFGIHLPQGAKIGGGLLIHHTGGVVINHLAVIGENCTLRHNVTIGTRRTSDDVPVLGNNVNIGTGAVILGKIRIGNNVSVGANAVVLTDVPDDCIAVGNPAVIRPKSSFIN